MLIHYTNCKKEYLSQTVDDLKMIGVTAQVDKPLPTIHSTSEEIESLGVVGIYIDVTETETRSGPTVVDHMWTAWLEKNPE